MYQYRTGKPADEHVLSCMLGVIHHRGPDDEGVHVEQALALGMRRLSIIDLDSGQQPIYNEDRSVVVVFNGEIYNYRELAAELRQRGHRFATASDTEVIVHLYEEMGEACVHQLRGMFAFALWDRSRRKLFIARDRLGIKPLYYAQVNDGLVFGSEIKAILQHPQVEAQLNLEALSHYLSLRYVPAPQTLFTNILSLPPGHTLSCDDRGVSTRRYWDLSFADGRNGHQSDEEYAEELESLLRDAVRLRLRSDVPFGAFLSGGVDSSTIVALMSQMLDEPVNTFSVGFEQVGTSTDELPHARLVAEQFHTHHHEIVTGPREFIDLADKIIWHLEQPIADQATIATYMVSKLAARHVKMVLTGEGGDELFAGYARYAGERLSPVFSQLPAPARSLLLAAGQHLPGLRRPKIALYALCQTDEVTRFTNWFPLFNQDMKAALLTEQFRQQINGISSDSIFSHHLAHTDATTPLNRMLYVDTKLWLADYLLLRGDKLTMAASLEGRVPLLDHKLVEFAATLPPRLKLRGWMRKYLLKEVSRKWLPEQIVDRKKEGFPIPISSWFRGEARDFLHDLLSPDTIRRRGLFDEGYVGTLLQEHDTGRDDHGVLLWGLANVELWQRLFLSAGSKAPHTSRIIQTREA